MIYTLYFYPDFLLRTLTGTAPKGASVSDIFYLAKGILYLNRLNYPLLKSSHVKFIEIDGNTIIKP